MKSFRCAIVRGGTSKGVFVFSQDLPPQGPERDRVIKRIMGTPDARQIDGLGGADILTSKVAILGPPSVPGADVDYTFAQVGIEKDTVSYEGNCGNISAAVGPIAIEEGFVRAKDEGLLKIRIHNTNVGKIITAEVPIKEGIPQSVGDYAIDGVPGFGAKIMLDFSETAGSVTGKLLPTGRVVDSVDVPGLGEIEMSIVDLANPVAFIRAESLGLTGVESPSAVDGDRGLIEKLEMIRGAAAVRLGFVDRAEDAFSKTPYIPFLCYVSGPKESSVYGENRSLSAGDIDMQARLVGFKRTHKTFPGTGAVCLAAAASLEGTLVHQASQQQQGGRDKNDQNPP